MKKSTRNILAVIVAVMYFAGEMLVTSFQDSCAYVSYGIFGHKFEVYFPMVHWSIGMIAATVMVFLFTKKSIVELEKIVEA